MAHRDDLVKIAPDLDVPAIEALPEGCRVTFLMHDVEGYKHREIASLLDITSGTSKRQLHRARMVVARNSADQEDLRQLLDMLGLIAALGGPYVSGTGLWTVGAQPPDGDFVFETTAEDRF